MTEWKWSNRKGIMWTYSKVILFSRLIWSLMIHLRVSHLGITGTLGHSSVIVRVTLCIVGGLTASSITHIFQVSRQCQLSLERNHSLSDCWSTYTDLPHWRLLVYLHNLPSLRTAGLPTQSKFKKRQRTHQWGLESAYQIRDYIPLLRLTPCHQLEESCF